MRLHRNDVLFAAFGVVATLTIHACTHAQEQRAVTVAECLVDVLHDSLDGDNGPVTLPTKLSELSENDLNLAINVVDGVRACRRKVANQPAPAAAGAPSK